MESADQINQEYQKLCAELGQLTLQRMDLGEQLQKMDAHITKLRADSRKLAAQFEKVTKEGSNGTVAAVQSPAG